MPKKREREVVNPLNMDYVSAIGRPPSERPEQPAVEESAATAVVTETKPAPPAADSPRRKPSRRMLPASGQASSRPVPDIRPRDEPEKDSYQLKTRFSPQEADHIEAFRLDLSDRLGVKLRGSQISRALWTLALRAEEALDEVRPPELRRPSYGDPLAMAAFEDAIAEYLLSALKRTRKHD